MSWWLAAPSLTPLAAWDASRADSTRLFDGVGTNHITRTSATAISDFLARGVAGNGNPMPLTTPILVPTTGVIAGFWTIRRRHVLLSRAYGETSYYLLHQSESNLSWYTNNNALGMYGAMTKHWVDAPIFAAVLTRGTDSVMYINGAWFGTPVPMTSLPSQIGVVGYGANGNEYNLDADEYLHGLGFWTGAPSLADLQTLESALRAAVAGQPMFTRGFFEPLGCLGNAPPQMLPGGASVTVPIGACTGVRHSVSAGTGFVAGTVKEKAAPTNVPLRRRVLLLDEKHNLVLAETWSDVATGGYRFDNLDLSIRYTVMAYDHTEAYRAVVADNLRAEPLP